MSLSALSIRRPVTTLMFYAGVVLLGVVSFRRLSVDFLPPVSVPRLTIHAACPEFSPEEMDDRVARPLAAAAGTVSGVKKTSSLSRRGTAVVTVEFSWGVDMDYAMLEVREKLDQLAGELPPEAGRPGILRVDPAAEPVITIGVAGASSLSADSSNLTELTETCNALLKKRLEQVEGIAQVQVLGGVEREVRVDVDEEKLLAFGLTIEEVARAISMENVTVSGGTIASGPVHLPLRFLGELTGAEEITRLTVPGRESGRPLRLTDLVTVRDTIGERTGWTRFNGKEILVLQVRKEAGSNTLVVSDNVRQALDRLALENPGLRLHILIDQAEFIRGSVAEVEQSIVWGALLAFLVLFLFLKGIVDPCIVGVTMPISILATLVAMSALGISLNVVSLTGLALGIGMLGDNAIIVIENVRRLRVEGFSMSDAVVTGAREINLAVTASTMTNVAVFLPVLFVQSVAQQLFVDMAITMTVSLLISLLVAVSLVPVLLILEPAFGRAARLLGQSFRWATRVATAIDVWGRAWIDRILPWVLVRRGWVVFATIAIFAVSIVAAGFVATEPAPEIDRKRFVVDVTTDAGMSASTLGDLGKRFENLLRGIPGVTGVYTAGGVAANPDVWSLADASPGHIHFEIVLADSQPTVPAMTQARDRLHDLSRSLSRVELAVKPGATTFERILRPQSSDVVIRVQGNDPSVNSRIAQEFARQVQNLPGLADLNVPSGDGAPEYRVKINRTATERYGITAQEIGAYISRQTSASDVTMLARIDQQIPVKAQPENLSKKRIEDLLSSSLLCRGAMIPFRELVACEQSLASAEIRREDGLLTVAVTANAVGRSIGALADDLRKAAAKCDLPAGYSISIGGENEEMESSFRNLAVIIGLSLLLVYMILAAEYESLLYPFVILLTSPLAFTGAVLAMLLAGEKYNVMSLVGIVIMIGAVDNDAVIVVDVITALRRNGLNMQEAICSGMRQRLRPILMTTATTILGMLPLIFNLGQGSELIRALTIPLAGGLVTSTLFTLVVIPVVYTYINSWASRKV